MKKMGETVKTTTLISALFTARTNRTMNASVGLADIQDEKAVVFVYMQIVLYFIVLKTGAVGNTLVITSLSKPWRKLKSCEILVLS